MPYGLENEAGDALEKYPYRFRDFKADNPEVSIREDMDAVVSLISRVVQVTERGPRPDASNPLTKLVIRGPEVKTGGLWSETWTERDLTAEEIAANALAAADAQALADVKLDPFIDVFVGMTKQQVVDYVDTNINNLNSAKSVIEKMAIMLLILAKRELREVQGP